MGDELPLLTARLALRPLRLGDAAGFLALNAEPAARAWLPDQVYRDLGEAEAAIASLLGQAERPGDPRRGPLVLAVELRAGAELVGHVGLSPLGAEVEVGFAIAQRHHGRGLAAEAVAAAAGWGLHHFGLARILGVAAAGNLASQRTLLRAGFAPLGLREMTLQGRAQPAQLYALASPRAEGT